MKRLIPGLLATALTGHAFAQTCPANVMRTAPDSRYDLLNGGAEVWDKQTGLVWQRCSLGQSWDGNVCTGVAARYTWQQALEVAKAAGGGWTLPDIRELRSLVERGCYNPAVNIMAFPSTPLSWPSSWHVASSPVAGYGRGAWFVNLADGSDGHGGFDSKHFASSVRLVRNLQ